MTYQTLLTQLIDNSGKTLGEIKNELKLLSIDITTNYLSILKNTEGKIASEEVSRALAKVCDAEYEDILIMQGYIDRAPKAVLNLFMSIKDSMYKTTREVADLALTSREVSQEQYEQIRAAIEKESSEISLAFALCAYQKHLETFSLENMKKDTEALVQELGEEKLKNIKSKKWLLVPLDDEEEPIPLSQAQVNSLTRLLNQDNS